MTQELDLLMSLDPLDMTNDDIDEIILHHRRHRVQLEHGVKLKKSDLTSRSKQSLENVLSALKVSPTPQQTIKRRI